jgi:hypothetical protein
LRPFSGQKREQDFAANFVQPLPEDQRQARRRQLNPGVNLIKLFIFVTNEDDK